MQCELVLPNEAHQRLDDSILKEAADAIGSVEGIVVVAMHPRAVDTVSVLLPDYLKHRMFADIGTVVSSQDCRFKVGEDVLCDPWHGHNRFQPFQLPSGTLIEDLRFYGMVGQQRIREDVSLSVPCALTAENTVVPKGRKLFIRRFPNADMSEGGITLPGSMNWRTCKAYVVAVGESCTDIQDGMVIVYSPTSPEIGFDDILRGFNTKKYPGDVHDYAFINETDVLGVLNGQELPWRCDAS